MKKKRAFLAAVLAVVMSLSMAVPAFAAEVAPDTAEPLVATTSSEDGEYGIMPLTNYSVGPNWKTCATGTDLTGVAVRIDVHDFHWTLHQVNVRYYRNGVLMRHDKDDDNVTKASGAATVYCIPGATEMQMQIVPRFWGVQDQWYQVTISY